HHRNARAKLVVALFDVAGKYRIIAFIKGIKQRRKGGKIARVAEIDHQNELKAELTDLDINRLVRSAVGNPYRCRMPLQALKNSLEQAGHVRNLRADYRISRHEFRYSLDLSLRSAREFLGVVRPLCADQRRPIDVLRVTANDRKPQMGAVAES